jgi:hypothetical protein
MSEKSKINNVDKINNRQINEDKFNEAIMKSAGVIQKYMEHVFGLSNLFNEYYEVHAAKFQNTVTGETHKLKLALVDKDYMFDLEVFNKGVVRQEMNNMVQWTHRVMYNVLKTTIKEDGLDEDLVAKIKRSILFVDGHNTTMFAIDKEDKEWSNKVKDETPKRIGFVWVR